MKRRRNPYSNSYFCELTPHKVRYLKSAFAWEVGAKQIAKHGVALYIYKCPGCAGWHLTKKASDNVVPIVTKATPGSDVQSQDSEGK